MSFGFQPYEDVRLPSWDQEPRRRNAIAQIQIRPDLGFVLYNGVSYPTLSAALAAGLGTFNNATVVRYAMDASQSFAANILREYGGIILYEPASTNLVPLSRISGGWGVGNAAITINGAIRPDGLMQCSILTENAAVGTDHYCVQNPAFPLTIQRYRCSAFVKRGTVGNRNVSMQFWTSTFSGGSGNDTNLTDGSNISGYAFGDLANWVGGSVAAPNGFYRINSAIDCTVAAPGGFVAYLKTLEPPNNTNYNGDGVSFNDYWGFNVELAGTGYFLNNPSSFINTGAGNEVRLADALVINVPVGLTTLTITFDDNTTQVIVTGAGAYALPTNINRPFIKKMIWT